MVNYEFQVFAKAGIAPCPEAIVYGVCHGLFSPSVVSQFEEWMILNRGVDGSAELLLFEGNREEAIAALESAGYYDMGDGADILRYAVLKSLKTEGRELLEDIESVYADFDYPKEMEPFIYYMPSIDGDRSEDALIARFHEFVLSEKERLGL